MKRITFNEWIKVKESEVVMGNRCVTNKDVGPDAQVQGDPCKSAELGKQLLLDKKQKKQKKT